MKYEITEITKTFTTTVIDVDEHERSLQECDLEAICKHHDGSGERFFDTRDSRTVLVRATIKNLDTGDVIYDISNGKLVTKKVVRKEAPRE